MSWQVKKIGDISNVISGYAFKANDFISDGVPIIKIKNIRHYEVDLTDSAYVEPSFLDINQRYHVQENDILISLTGSHITLPSSVVGRVAKYRHSQISLLNQRAGKFIDINKDACNRDFLYQFLTLDKTRNLIALKAQGAANQANISPNDVKDILINLPPIKTQQKIATILTAYDDLMYNNLKRIKLLEDAAFTKYKILKTLHQLTENTIDELCIVVMGQSPESEFYNETKDGLPFHQGVTNFNFRFVEHKIYTTKLTRIAEPNDILFSVRAPVGKLNIALDKLCIGRGLGAFRSKKNNQSYLYYQLKDYFFQLDMLGSGSIFNSVTKNELLNVKLKTLPESVIQEFERFSVPIDNQIKCLTMQNHKLKEARDILLPRLMNREIEI